MRTFFFSFFMAALASLAACRGEEKKDGSSQDHATASVNGDFYKRLSGTIGGKPVVMHLHRIGKYAGGSYYYVSSGIPIGLYNWVDTTDDATFELTEHDATATVSEDYRSAQLRLTLDANSATGTWISGDSTRRLDVVLREEYPDGSRRLGVAHLEDSMRMFATKPEPMARAFYGSVVAGSKEDAWLDEQLRKAFGESAVIATTWKQALRNLAGNYFADYRKDGSDLDSNDAEALQSTMHSYSTESRITVLMNDDGWLILRNEGYDYTGGAHGNHGSSFLNMDVTGQHQWELTDVVADTAGLAPFLASAATTRFGLMPDESLSNRLFVPAIPVTDNFYLTTSGLGFVYNPYEIASYADGEVHLFIPYKRLLLLLTEGFKQRMGLNSAAVMRG